MTERVLSNEELTEFKVIFNVFDPNETGRITADSLEVLLRKLGHRPTQDETRQMIKQISTDPSMLSTSIYYLPHSLSLSL